MTGLQVALETSQRAASVAACLGERRLERRLAGEHAHASDCVGELSSLLEELGTTPAEIDAVFVGTGPGSYTGLRIGIGTALGLARGAGARLRGVPSGESIVWSACAPGEAGSFLLDARQEQLYLAHYERTEDEVEVLLAPRVVSRAELAEHLPSEGRIFGDARALELGGLPELATERFAEVGPPTAAALLELGSRRLERHGGQAFDEVLPLYLRPFQAKVRRR